MPIPPVAFCETRRRLLQSIADAVSEFVAIQRDHLENIINGEPDLDGYDQQIRKASAVKEERKRAYIDHVKEHGC